MNRFIMILGIKLKPCEEYNLQNIKRKERKISMVFHKYSCIYEYIYFFSSL